MKRKDVIRRITELGAVFVREVADTRFSYKNPRTDGRDPRAKRRDAVRDAVVPPGIRPEVRRFSSRPSEPAGGGEEPYSRTATNPDDGIAPVSAKNAALLLRLLDSKWPEVLQSRGLTQDSRTDDATRIDASARELVAFGPSESEAVDNVEGALAFALAEAARAGNWDVVSQLARLLEARFAQTSTR